MKKMEGKYLQINSENLFTFIPQILSHLIFSNLLGFVTVI